jgi:transcriptional regulator with XRE-family HTH domain
MESFGQWVRDQRVRLGLSATQCAAKAGMKLTQWSRMERTVKRPFPETCAAVAHGLGIPAADVLTAAGYAAEQDPSETDLHLAKRLSSILSTLPPEERKRVEDLLEQDASQYVKLVEPLVKKLKRSK